MPEQSVEKTAKTLGRKLDKAWETRTPIPPLTESDNLDSVEEAYAAQSEWSKLRLSRGERIIGRKIGLTSKVVQEQMGVNEPDYGNLWASSYFPAVSGRVVEIPTDAFLQPRLEGELAFLIGKPLGGPDVTLQEVLAATHALATAVEVIDSRIEGWRIKLPDTIADNASYGGFTLGPWSTTLREADLRTLGMLIHQNGLPTVQAIGAAALGNPARAVAWLATKLSSFGVSLEPGDIVLSGALGRALPVQQGDVFVLETHGQPPLTVAFT